jgi:uncharacterized protein
VNKVFWVCVAADALLFFILLIITLKQPGPSSGGREMSLAFSIFLPAVIIGASIALYLFSTTHLWRTVALLIVAGPGLLLAIIHTRDAYLNYRVAQTASGRGYFSSSILQQMGEAVVRRDLATLQKLGPQCNVNEAGDKEMTLLRLAVAEEFSAQGTQSPSELPIIRALLALGAKPAPGLEDATKLRDPAILRALLEAGADPNSLVSGSPVAFAWINIMPVENLRLLADHGANVNITDQFGTPLVLSAAEQGNWDAVIFLLEHGADPRRPDRDGRTLSSFVDERLNDQNSSAPKELVQQVRQRIDAMQHT